MALPCNNTEIQKLRGKISQKTQQRLYQTFHDIWSFLADAFIICLVSACFFWLDHIQVSVIIVVKDALSIPISMRLQSQQKMIQLDQVQIKISYHQANCLLLENFYVFFFKCSLTCFPFFFWMNYDKLQIFPKV